MTCSSSRQPTGRWQATQRSTPRGTQRAHALEDLRQKMHQFVIQELGPILYDQRVSEADLRKQVEEQLHRGALAGATRAARAANGSRSCSRSSTTCSATARSTGCCATPASTKSWSTGPSQVYVERNGKIELTDVRFVDETHLRRIIDKIVSQVGRRVDEATPDGRRPPPRRLPRERRRAPARHRRAVHDDPAVRRRTRTRSTTS